MFYIKFEDHAVTADNWTDAMACAIALAKNYSQVVIWQGDEIKWKWTNKN